MLSEIKSPIEKELEDHNTLLKEALNSSVPLIDSVVDYFLSTKGKMVRPILVLLSAKLSGNGEISNTAKLSAVALELLHNASLIHDDVVDESDSRRGMASVNNMWDNKVAVLIGDFFLSRCLIKSTETESQEIQRELALLASALSQGEVLQLANARGRTTDEESYFAVIRNKTASLFTACMRVGAISSDATKENVDLLGEFGDKLGIIFQIRDDIFDYYDDPKIGKPTVNDIREGKRTLHLLYVINNEKGEENIKMKSIIEKDNYSPEDISMLINYAKEKGGIDYSYNTMNQIAADALKILDSFEDSEAKKSLTKLVNYIIIRKK